MELFFTPFNIFLDEKTSAQVRNQKYNYEIEFLNIDDDLILGHVADIDWYEVEIIFDEYEVIDAFCGCFNEGNGACSHIVHVMRKADEILAERFEQLGKTPVPSESESDSYQTTIFDMEDIPSLKPIQKDDAYILKDQYILDLDINQLDRISFKGQRNSYSIHHAVLEPNIIKVVYGYDYYPYKFYQIHVEQTEKDVVLKCSCKDMKDKICTHLYCFLREILLMETLKFPFNTELRLNYIKKAFHNDGIKDIPVQELDDLTQIEIENNRVYLIPKINILFYNKNSQKKIKEYLPAPFELPPSSDSTKSEFILVNYSHYQESQLNFELYQAPLSKAGKIKSPLTPLNPAAKIRECETKEELLFYTAFQNFNYNWHNDESNHQSILDILKNPKNLPFYFLKDDDSWKNKPTPAKIKPIKMEILTAGGEIKATRKDDLFLLQLSLKINGKTKKSSQLKYEGDFIKVKDNYYYIKEESLKNALNFFDDHEDELFIHPAHFPSFKSGFLDPLEEHLKITYDFISKATQTVLKKKSAHEISEHLIYLTESEDYILITPVVRYGEIEVSALSQKQVHIKEEDEKEYSIPRDEKKEDGFIYNIRKTHPDFEDSVGAGYFYLHKTKFIEDAWFLEAFDFWRSKGYEILGFNQLKNNSYNPYKMNIQTSVQSGIDWFDIHVDISFGNQKVRLKDLKKSVVNKTRYVKLDDGTLGLLPDEWIEKFAWYFRAGQIEGEYIRVHKSNFQLIDNLFEAEVLSAETKIQIQNLKTKLSEFQSIDKAKIPKKLKAELRSYQKEGLNWLNFLDEFGFGGILADDMGLGKTIQIIAYFLLQHEKGNQEPNLVIVPTSLLFNWKNEIEKFAPHLRYLLHYGTNRKTEEVIWSDYDVILTTYGTLLSDIKLLKTIDFNILVLDESQAIKNPESKRYKASRLLSARQRIAATGTPVENNTFDLYAQLSFVMPGLLGGKKNFKDDYSTPIDKFQNDSRAKELQQKVHPFILRRTKKQVATELPEKTEITIRCEMEKDQRKVYDTYKKEFQLYLKGKSDEEIKSSSLHILQGLTKLRQICNSPALLSDEGFYGQESAKLKELMVQINKLKDEHKILVFSQFVGMLELIKQELDNEDIAYSYLTGKTRKRQEEVDKFQNDPNIRVFLISLKAGGTGLNLTEAEYVFIVDPWWNPAVENQAIDRVYRIGQKNKVIAVRLISPDSIEEKIIDLQQRKLQLVEDLIHTDTNTFKQLSKEDLMELV